MRYDDFVHRVQERAGLGSHGETQKLIEANLETLGERISRRGREHLAAQLPKELKEFIFKRQNTVLFSLEEFRNRVTQRTGMGYPQSVRGIKAVAGVLREAVSEGELKEILSELPDEYKELFDSV